MERNQCLVPSGFEDFIGEKKVPGSFMFSLLQRQKHNMGACDCETIIKNAIGLKWSVGRTTQWQNPRAPGVARMGCAEDSPLWHKSATAQGLLCTAAKPVLPGTEEKPGGNGTRCNPLFLLTIPYPTWVPHRKVIYERGEARKKTRGKRIIFAVTILRTEAHRRQHF